MDVTFLLNGERVELRGVDPTTTALDWLREQGIEDDTMVIFMSDNGGCHESVERRKLDKPGTQPGEPGSFVAYRRPWANASNTPFRLYKHWVHEGGIASPELPTGRRACTRPTPMSTGS